MKYLTNPFNYANEEPKVHDSEVLTSYGHKNQITSPLGMPVENIDEQAHIFFLPGLHCALTIRGLVEPTLIPTAQWNASNHIFWPDPQHRLDIVGDNVAVQSLPLEAIRQWRLVSAAFKVNVLNTADSNDGWFEAIRFKPNYSMLASGVFNGQNAISTSGSAFVGVTPVDNPDLLMSKSTIQLSQMPSYQTGRLRDLNDLMFMLHRDDVECPWTREVDENWPLGESTPGETIKELSRAFYDNNFDGIYLRIYGRKDPAADAKIFCRGTRLLLEAASNVEYIFSPSNPLFRVMSKSWNKTNYVKAVIARIQKVKTPGRTSSAIYKSGGPPRQKKWTKKRKFTNRRRKPWGKLGTRNNPIVL